MISYSVPRNYSPNEMVLNLNTNGFSPHISQICKRDYGFQAMQGCNDCVFDCHGNLWITAPAGSIAPAAYKRSMEVRMIVQFTFFLYMTCPNTLQKMVNRKTVKFSYQCMPPQIIGLKSCLEEIAFRCLYGNRNVMWWDTKVEKVATGAF